MAAEQRRDRRAGARPCKAKRGTVAFASAGFSGVARPFETGHGRGCPRLAPLAALRLAGQLRGRFRNRRRFGGRGVRWRRGGRRRGRAVSGRRRQGCGLAWRGRSGCHHRSTGNGQTGDGRSGCGRIKRGHRDLIAQHRPAGYRRAVCRAAAHKLAPCQQQTDQGGNRGAASHSERAIHVGLQPDGPKPAPDASPCGAVWRCGRVSPPPCLNTVADSPFGLRRYRPVHPRKASHPLHRSQAEAAPRCARR